MKYVTCTVCSIGCPIFVEAVDEQVRISGNQCAKGEEFAKTKTASPARSITTTVRTVFPRIPVLPVRTNGEVPKEKVTEIIGELSKVVITKKIGIGEIVAANILGTGCDVIAASDVLRKIL
jgi:CxxC motif-containing protein